MFADKEKGVVVDFQSALEEHLKDLGKSKNFQEAKKVAQERKIDTMNIKEMLAQEEILEILDLEPDDLIHFLEIVEHANPEIIERQKSEINHLKQTCKAHYEKWERSEIDKRKLEIENTRLKNVSSAIQGIKESFAENTLYYTTISSGFLILSVWIVLSIMHNNIAG